MSAPRYTLPESFYANPDVVGAAKKLLGKVICSTAGSGFTAGIITETEAYCGRNDKACHANNGLRTERTEVMYGKPGHAYIYLCYGIHHLLNVVTNREGLADAVLIRGIQPLEGLDVMMKRRNKSTKTGFTDGPGKLTQALGVTTLLNKTHLSKPPLWIEDRGIVVPDQSIMSTPRIGVDYAGKDAMKPWRFLISDN